jgi:hypothetical protein
MAHSPLKIVAGFNPAPQSQTLFLPAPGKRGILVTHRRGRTTAKVMQFPCSHAALTWCERRRAGLVYYFDAPVRN